MRRWILAAGFLCAAATAVPEPPGYWTGSAQAPVPPTIAGGTVIHTDELDALLRKGGVVLIDVANAVHRPANLPSATLWLLPPHRDIPGSVWIPDVGKGALAPAEDAAFRAKLRALTEGDTNRPVIVYCHHACWLSWNAAKRAITYGYRRVFWYPDGVEGWMAAGKTLEVVKAST
jgi:PQQ-dependent catabolism-associated CXXCW motif protein